MIVIPKNFEEWKICITDKCKIKLTAEFAENRLAVYSDENIPETQRFVKLYGIEHLQNIRRWLSTILSDNITIEN
ncbi:hypothetical protein [Sphingobacterium hungaricum]|uniref:Uncharacterized protein n=1 Tax=Sphingobacterium hungaricum TaxID=2082723 RepID=A0A928UVR8_9SPHI|nr:hypothetical protein [Sphingobacterium hungaricum]MBE8712818.1 hypothetical protein [Sphingobacterium hungaricum]